MSELPNDAAGDAQTAFPQLDPVGEPAAVLAEWLLTALVERDAARRLALYLFRKLPMMEQLYGEGPAIIAHHPWMLEEGPWQASFKEEGPGD